MRARKVASGLPETTLTLDIPNENVSAEPAMNIRMASLIRPTESKGARKTDEIPSGLRIG